MTAPRARVMRDGASVMIPAADVVVGDVLLLEAGDIVPADARLRLAHALTDQRGAADRRERARPEADRARGRGRPPGGAHRLRLHGDLGERRDGRRRGDRDGHGHGAGQDRPPAGGGEAGGHAAPAAAGERRQDPALPLPRHRGAGGDPRLLEGPAADGGPSVVRLPGRGGGARGSRGRGHDRAGPRRPAHGLAPRPRSARCPRWRPSAAPRSSAPTRPARSRPASWWSASCGGRSPRPPLRVPPPAATPSSRADGRSGTGDPTELAILMAAAQRGIDRKAIESERPRVAVEPFDADTKRMSIRRADGKLYVKGAVEVVLPVCASGTENAVDANAGMARRGLRVLAVAVGRGCRRGEPQAAGTRRHRRSPSHRGHRGRRAGTRRGHQDGHDHRRPPGHGGRRSAASWAS